MTASARPQWGQGGRAIGSACSSSPGVRERDSGSGSSVIPGSSERTGGPIKNVPILRLMTMLGTLRFGATAPKGPSHDGLPLGGHAPPRARAADDVEGPNASSDPRPTRDQFRCYPRDRGGLQSMQSDVVLAHRTEVIRLWRPILHPRGIEPRLGRTRMIPQEFVHYLVERTFFAHRRPEVARSNAPCA